MLEEKTCLYKRMFFCIRIYGIFCKTHWNILLDLEIEPSEMSLLNPFSLQKHHLLLYLSTEFKKGLLKMLFAHFPFGDFICFCFVFNQS